MKPLLFLLLFLLTTAAVSAQSTDLVILRDSLNHFSIGIPAGWRYQSNPATSRLKLIAARTSADTSDIARESLNLNILHKFNSSTSQEYRKLMNALLSLGGMTILERDSMMIHGQPWLWFTDRHQNDLAPGSSPLVEYVLITYKNDRTYILTFTAPSDRFEKYRALFVQIAATIQLDDDHSMVFTGSTGTPSPGRALTGR